MDATDKPCMTMQHIKALLPSYLVDTTMGAGESQTAGSLCMLQRHEHAGMRTPTRGKTLASLG